MKSILFFLSCFFILAVGCSPEDATAPSKQINGSLFVTVQDPSGKPVADASIVISGQSAITDAFGTLFFPQISLTGDDFLEVKKAGYFNGSRRFSTSSEQTQFVNITLLPQVEVGSFSADRFELISVDGSSTLFFPDHAVVREDGSLYHGNVHVMASPIYGNDPLLSQKMPGSLTGLDLSGAKVALSSFGMMAVEIQGDNGEVLQIAPGKTVEMRLALSSQQMNQAPATIPLWYFDEIKGFWIEEGQAILDGQYYVAQLPHFSYWNCDDTFSLVEWSKRFVYSDGRPAQHTEVCLTIERTNDQRCSYTDADGVVSGGVPGNEAMTLTILDDCGEIVFTEGIGPFSGSAIEDTKVLEDFGSNMASVSGIALQCDGMPLASGFVRLRTPWSNYILPVLDAEGHFETNYFYCQGDVVSLQVIDTKNSLTSLPQILTFERSLTGLTLKACDQVEEFIRYKITGFPQEYIYYQFDVEVDRITRIESVDSIGFRGRLGWTFDGVIPGQYKAYTLYGNQINLPNGQVGYVQKMDLNVTEFGGPGGYIRGSFSGKIDKGGNGSGGPSPSDFSGTFSVKNE